MTGKSTATDIEALIAEFQQSGMRELHLRADGVEIYLSTDPDSAGLDGPAVVTRTDAAASPAPSPSPAKRADLPAAAPAASAVSPADAAHYPDGATIVRAPYLGTFYRAPKPGSPVYVEVGSAVTAETEICLVEVMKLFTAVRAGIAGTVHAVLAQDGQMVQADQPLFVIVPAA